jgi:GAF domain-containing protein
MIGGLTVCAALGIALSSQAHLITSSTLSRDALVIHSVDRRIQARLRAISTAIENVTAGADGDRADMLRRLKVVFESSPEDFDTLLVADREGGLLLSLSDEGPARKTARGTRAFSAASAGRSGFVMIEGDSSRWELWFLRTALVDAGTPLYILAQVDVRFLDDVIDTVAERGARQSVLLLAGPRVLTANRHAEKIDASTAVWRESDESLGTVFVRTSAGESLKGHFGNVGTLEGLGWRIVVAEPIRTSYYDLFASVLPLLGALTVGGVIALMFAWGMSLGVVKPLRELQRAARAAAAGSYVRPLVVKRDDEIGQVSQAFNAVALRLNALHDLSQLLAGATKVDQVLDAIVAAVGHLLGGGSVVVYLLEGGEFLPVRTRGGELLQAGPVAVGASDWFEAAQHELMPVEFSGANEDLQRQLPGYTGEDMVASAMPLFAHGHCLGMVVVARRAARPFSDAEIEMLKTFSAQASLAVHTSRMFEKESESRRMAEALRGVAEELVRPEQLEETVMAVERIACEFFSAVDVRIILGNPTTMGAQASTRANDAEFLAAGLSVLAGKGSKESAVIRVGDSVATDSLLGAIGADNVWILGISPSSDHPAVMAVSLLGRGLSPDEWEVARAIADEVALALDNAYFFHRALARGDNLENIFHISQAVGSSLQVNVVLNRVLEVVQKILSADALALISFDPVRRCLRMSMGRGALPKGMTELELKSGEDIPGEVFARGEPVAMRNFSVEAGGVAGMAASVGLRSLLAVPLVARGRSIGVLMVFAAHDGGFAEEDANVLRTFASQAALAIDTASLYSREHEVAEVLQKSILPEALPDLPELDAASVYSPAGEHTDIGGDYYDVFRTSDGLIWIAIGDVCGKGIHAATKTSRLKYVVRALATAGLQPAEIISHANNMISESDDPSDIVTLWVGNFHPGFDRICWANGGHPPALIRRRDGSIEELEPTGALLGAQSGISYEQAESSFATGDTLLLYTDGVSDARSGNTFFGMERIRQVMEAEGTPAEIVQRLVLGVSEYVHGDLRDDVAILAVAPRPKPTDG